MKQINYSQKNPSLGNLKGILRIIGKTLYFKFNNNQHANQVIENLKSKGAVIEHSKNGWIYVDMFKDKTMVKLGNKEFDVEEKSNEDVEQILYEFYMIQFTKANFKCEGKMI